MSRSVHAVRATAVGTVPCQLGNPGVACQGLHCAFREGSCCTGSGDSDALPTERVGGLRRRKKLAMPPGSCQRFSRRNLRCLATLLTTGGCSVRAGSPSRVGLPVPPRQIRRPERQQPSPRGPRRRRSGARRWRPAAALLPWAVLIRWMSVGAGQRAVPWGGHIRTARQRALGAGIGSPNTLVDGSPACLACSPASSRRRELGMGANERANVQAEAVASLVGATFSPRGLHECRRARGISVSSLRWG